MPAAPPLAILSWLLFAWAPARSELPPSARGKLLSVDRIDGQAFFAVGHPMPEENPAVISDPDAVRTRSALVMGWQPSFLGLEARLALGARFWESLPAENQAAHTRLISSGIGLDELWVKLPFEAFSWRAAVQAGILRWRTHGDAALMGEYLARWDAYPGVPIRWGTSWEPLDSLSTRLVGLRLSFTSPAGRFRQDALAIRDGRGDGSFAFLWSGDVTPSPGLTFGAGAALDDLQGGGRSYYVPVIYDDTTATSPPAGAPRDSILRFDAWATRFSARMTVDVATLWTGRPREDRGGRLFAEAALLGWKDYPPYYANRIRRLHLHAGAYLPAFGILQTLRLQVERHPVPDWMGFAPLYRDGATAPEYVRIVPPSPWWRAQVHLCRSLLPWLDLEATAWRGFGGTGGTGGSSASRAPYSTSTPAGEAETRLETRITARL